MKRTLLLTAIFALPMLGVAEDKPLKERAATAVEAVKRETKEATDATLKAARDAWKTTKAYLTQDPTEYRVGASQKLKELGGEIADLKVASKKEQMATRLYFSTRLQALREHHQYAQNELTKMPGDRDQKDFAAARKHFDRTVQTLEAAVDQAREEVRDDS